MAVSNMKSCAICGSEYNYCPSCERLGSWKYYADTPECFQIFMTLTELREGVLTNAEAKEQFARIGVTSDYDFSNFIPAVAELVKSIVSDETTEKSETKPRTKEKK